VPHRIVPDTDPNGVAPRLSRRAIQPTAFVLVGMAGLVVGHGWGELGWGAAFTLVLFGLMWAWYGGRGRARRRVIAARFPDDDVVEVLGAMNLRATLKSLGLLRRRAVGRWVTPSFSMVISDVCIGLWRGGRRPVQALELPWMQVQEVGPAEASITTAGPRPVAGLRVHGDEVLCFVPVRRVGGILAGSVEATDMLIDALQAHHTAAGTAVGRTPSPPHRRRT
jgi:hypothetical protein